MSHKKILMCNPKNFEVKYDINPWMQNINNVDNNLADTQWNSLLKLYQDLNIKVEQIKAEPNLPDMVFTANAGLVYKNMFFPSNFRFKERKPEQARFIDWFKKFDYVPHVTVAFVKKDFDTSRIAYNGPQFLRVKKAVHHIKNKD